MESKNCPYCGEEISASAKKCRFCGEWLSENDIEAPTPAPAPAPVESIGSKEKMRSTTFLKEYLVEQIIRRYADFSGFASRKTFWMTYLTFFILSVGVSGIAMIIMGAGGTVGMTIGSVLMGLFGLGITVPQLAICCRRLRDAGKSPYYIFLGLIPLAGPFILLVYFCKPTYYYDPITNTLVDRPNNPDVSFSTVDIGVTGSCIVLLFFGCLFMINSIGGFMKYSFSDTEYDLGEYTEVVNYDPAEGEYATEDASSERFAHNKEASLEQIADNIDPEYFSHELVTYEIGSDKNMNYLMQTTASTNVPIQASGMLDNHNITLEGWITEEGTIHGRYHNSNGINLDFNGFIRPDNSLYIQLGHDYEKSEWILHPVASELPDGYFRYEGYWGKKRLSSYLTFSEGK